MMTATTRPRRVSCARSWPGRLVPVSRLFWVRRHLCMDVTVSMGVMKTVLLLQNRLLNMVLLVCGCMYFGVLVNMDVVVAAATRPRRLSCARS